MSEFTQTVKIDCPACGNDAVIKHGFHSDIQRCQCKGGGKAQGRSYTPKTISAAVDAYYDRLSYRRIARNVGQAYGIVAADPFAIDEARRAIIMA